MKFLLILSIATLFAESSAVDTTDNRQWYPKYDVAGTCTTKLPLLPEGSRPYFASKEECCWDTFDSWGGNKTANCISGSTTTPVATAGTWYPDYPANWEAGNCINTLPLPPHGSRPLYPTQLECCKLAYAGQTNNFCFSNMVDPPTSTVSPTQPTASPTTSNPSKAPMMSSLSKAPTTKAPANLSPSNAPTTSSPSKAPTTKSPTATPTTGSPTSQYGTQWYPKYDAAGTCTTKLPLPPPGSRSSYFASKEECCQGTYATWEPPKAANCISGSTTTPVANPLDNPSSNPSKAPVTMSPFFASPSKAPVTASPSASPFQSSTASPSSASMTFPLILVQSSTARPSSASMTFPLILATGCSIYGLLLF